MCEAKSRQRFRVAIFGGKTKLVKTFLDLTCSGGGHKEVTKGKEPLLPFQLPLGGMRPEIPKDEAKKEKLKEILVRMGCGNLVELPSCAFKCPKIVREVFSKKSPRSLRNL